MGLINRKNIYVLQLQQESPDKHVTIVSVSEFATPSPILSMSILEAGIRKRADDPHTLSDVESDNENSDEENDEYMAEMLPHDNVKERESTPTV